MDISELRAVPGPKAPGLGEFECTSIDKFCICYIILQHAICEKKRIKRQVQYAQNKDAAKCYMEEYREKKKDSIQLSNKEYYKSNENKIRNSMKVNYEENQNDKRHTM